VFGLTNQLPATDNVGTYWSGLVVPGMKIILETSDTRRIFPKMLRPVFLALIAGMDAVADPQRGPAQEIPGLVSPAGPGGA
jgi:hypothetical protein